MSCPRPLAACAAILLSVSLVGCGSDDDPSTETSSAESSTADSSAAESSSAAAEETATPEDRADDDSVTAGGLTFAMPDGWIKVDAEELQQQAEGNDEVADAAERMGMTADQLTAMIGQAEVLVLDPDAKGGFADNINVMVPGGTVPPADEIEQQFAAIGATVKDVSTQSTDAGEVIRVRYTLPVSGKVQGEALVADVDGQAVTITVSASKRASTSTLVDGILGSLGTE